MVLDIDPRHNGDSSFAELESKYEKLPDTLIALTGGGGEHYIFRHPGGTVQNSSSKIGCGIDVKADGGYALVPPSNHKSGGIYRWDVAHHPLDGGVVAAAPAWLLELITSAAQAAQAQAAVADDAAFIDEGTRHDTLVRIAGRVRRRGDSPGVIVAALKQHNIERCRPLLPEDEILRIANDIGAKPPGEALVAAATRMGRKGKGQKPQIFTAAPVTIADRYVDMLAAGGTLKHFVGRWWRFDTNRYVEIINEDMRADLQRFIYDEVVLVSGGKDSKEVPPTTWHVNNALDGLRGRVKLYRTRTPPFWIDGCQVAGDDWVPVMNGLVNLRTGEFTRHRQRFFPRIACGPRMIPQRRARSGLLFLSSCGAMTGKARELCKSSWDIC